jgi:rhodanese-related sulfurtransferase
MATRGRLFQVMVMIPIWSLFILISPGGIAQGADDAAAKSYIIEKSAQLKWPSMRPEKFVELLVSGKKIAFIDVRSELETAVWYPKSDKAMDTFVISLQEIPARIGKIDPERYDYVVLTCPTGPRAAAGAVLARLMGYDNVYFLRGGNRALGSITGAKFRKVAKRLLKEGKIKKVPEWME